MFKSVSTSLIARGVLAIIVGVIALAIVRSRTNHRAGRITDQEERNTGLLP